MNSVPSDSPLTPNYWRHEASGRLEAPITRLLNHENLSQRDIHLIGHYLQQWIDSPLWEMNPAMSPSATKTLADLRARARRFATHEDLWAWTLDARGIGIDPF